MRLNEQFIQDNTKDWELEYKQGNIELWKFFDKVAWDESYALKVNGEIKMEIEDFTQAHFAVDVASAILNKEEKYCECEKEAQMIMVDHKGLVCAECGKLIKDMK